MPGRKIDHRIDKYTTPLRLYRSVAAADGAVDPRNPPDVPLIDNTGSVIGLNHLGIYVAPAAGAGCTVQIWIIQNNPDIGVIPAWVFFEEHTLGAAGRPQWYVTGQSLPVGKYAVVVTASTGAVDIYEEHSE